MPTNKQIADTRASLLMPGDVAAMLHVTTKTIARMAARGELKSITLPSGHRRYKREDVEAMLAPTTDSAEQAAS